ncbi:MAG: hypothetical protein AUG51_13940 [Acidobacteria bacterium 13_1_20CM_3_53_8]|nr:MAG: hypothetical protein AUG51_13940 [Acidobacteria bacterium 13_1_20CM_3_53_8]
MFDLIVITLSDTWNETVGMFAGLKKPLHALGYNLQLVAQVYVAHFIVWRELRRRRREARSVAVRS